MGFLPLGAALVCSQGRREGNGTVQASTGGDSHTPRKVWQNSAAALPSTSSVLTRSAMTGPSRSMVPSQYSASYDCRGDLRMSTEGFKVVWEGYANLQCPSCTAGLLAPGTPCRRP